MVVNKASHIACEAKSAQQHRNLQGMPRMSLKELVQDRITRGFLMPYLSPFQRTLIVALPTNNEAND